MLPVLLLLALSAGCRSRSDLVERQNHDLEVALREAHEQVLNTQAYAEAVQHELDCMRVARSPGHPLPEAPDPAFALKSIALSRQTGGICTDDLPGDDALEVVVEPIDLDGHAIKAPGTLRVELFQVTGNSKKPISAWQIGNGQLRVHWRSGLFSSGYAVTLPWKTWPNSESLHVAATFTLPDGRSFSDEKDVTVKLRPEAKRKAIAADPNDGPSLDEPQAPTRKLELSPAPVGPKLESKKDGRDRQRRTSDADVQAVSGAIDVELGTPELRK